MADVETGTSIDAGPQPAAPADYALIGDCRTSALVANWSD